MPLLAWRQGEATTDTLAKLPAGTRFEGSSAWQTPAATPPSPAPGYGVFAACWNSFAAIFLLQAKTPMPACVPVTGMFAREIISIATALCLDSTAPGNRTTPALLRPWRNSVLPDSAVTMSGVVPVPTRRCPRPSSAQEIAGTDPRFPPSLDRCVTREVMDYRTFVVLPRRPLARPGPGPDNA